MIENSIFEWGDEERGGVFHFDMRGPVIEWEKWDERSTSDFCVRVWIPGTAQEFSFLGDRGREFLTQYRKWRETTK